MCISWFNSSDVCAGYQSHTCTTHLYMSTVQTVAQIPQAVTLVWCHSYLNCRFNGWFSVDVPLGNLTLLLHFFWKMYLGEEWGNNPQNSLAAGWTDYIIFSTTISNIPWKWVASLANMLLPYHFLRFNDNKQQSSLITLGNWRKTKILSGCNVSLTSPAFGIYKRQFHNHATTWEGQFSLQVSLLRELFKPF